MMNCHQTTKLLSDAQERKLTWKERLAIRLHITMCYGCRNFADQVPLLRTVARAYAKGNDVGKAPPEQTDGH